MSTSEEIIAAINTIDPEVLAESGWRDPKGYLNRTYRFLNTVQPGKHYRVSELAKAETAPLFILLVKLYICECGTITFTDETYSRFYKQGK